jgi:hypothetical protein
LVGEEVDFNTFEEKEKTEVSSSYERPEKGNDGENLQPKRQKTNQSPNLEIWIRINPLKEYIKLVVKDGRVIGCLLIGNTELEEVFENLILNRLNVEDIGIKLLDPTVDIGVI